MRWKISIEGPDEIAQGQRFEIEKDFDDLPEGKVGLSVEDGKEILSLLPRFLVEQQCAVCPLFRRHCQSCDGARPVKDYSSRTIQTVFRCCDATQRATIRIPPLRARVRLHDHPSVSALSR